MCIYGLLFLVLPWLAFFLVLACPPLIIPVIIVIIIIADIGFSDDASN